MKKTLSIILLTFIMLVFSACKNEENIESNSSTGYESDTKPIVMQTPVKHENPRVNYTVEEASDIIVKNSKFTAADDLYVDAPKSIDHVSAFFNGTAKPLPPKEAIEEVWSVFDFLFPGHYFDENCFYYYGSETIEECHDGNYIRVSERYDTLVNSDEEIYMLFYDESETNKEDRVALTMQSPFGNTIATINKGVAHKIAYQNGTATDYGYGGDVFMAEQHFTYVESYPPDSKEVFKLLDKETSIKDAVDFFEDYVKSLPCAVEQCFSIKVIDVQVYKAKDDLYCYNFTTTKVYDGIPFDFAISGSHGGRDNRYIGIGEMIKSNDVDFIYGTFKTDTVMEEQQFSDIIPLEEAVKIASEEMTDYVDFEAKAVQLVYCLNDDIGGTGKLGETREPVFPAWKLTLYNPNDDCSYSCYVNVLNGDFESYRGS